MCSVFRWVIVIEIIEPAIWLAQVAPAETWTVGNIVGLSILGVVVIAGVLAASRRLR